MFFTLKKDTTLRDGTVEWSVSDEQPVRLKAAAVWKMNSNGNLA